MLPAFLRKSLISEFALQTLMSIAYVQVTVARNIQLNIYGLCIRVGFQIKIGQPG